MEEKSYDDLRDNHIDDHVDEEIMQCFNEHNTRSFFVFAGAGAGKTRSLVNTLKYLEDNLSKKLNVHAQKIVVITYTNAACEEILRRIDYNSIFSVQTIHSFLWELIKEMQHDIKKWLKDNLLNEINDLEEQQAKWKKGVTYDKRAKKIEDKRKRLEKIENIQKFIYNPNGENLGYDSLNHAEVVKMGSEFIINKPVMQKILINKYPILLIDESQDTKKELVDALMVVHNNYKDNIIIGMFGDTMQRIYLDGKENLEDFIPDDWAKPNKIMNHRSAKRIVELANSIRKNVDGKVQKYRTDASEGNIMLFICDKNLNKAEIEKYVLNRMAEISKDEKWLTETKKLILEHHMAANRLGFNEFFSPIYNVEKFKNGILDGSLTQIKFFTSIIIPLIQAHQANNSFEEMKIIRKYSPIMNKKNFNKYTKCQREILQNIKQSVNELYKLWNDGREPNCIEILKNVEKSGLFEIPDKLRDILLNEDLNEEELAMRQALSTSFYEIIKYDEYINGNSEFATHQGVKGLEFPRVMVIIDDEEAKGFLFSYEKLFGAKEKSETDIKNELDGKDTSMSRTARLFYVACTRAEKSLAIIAYTENIDKVRNTLIANNWFYNHEIEIINNENIL